MQTFQSIPTSSSSYPLAHERGIGLSRGVVIQLFHGATIEWDGKIIGIASSMPDVEADVAVYGVMFGSSH